MPNCVYASYWSPTGTTRAVTERIALTIAKELNLPCKVRSFTLPQERKEALKFAADDIVVFGMPVYAGRVPNIMLKYLKTMEGNKALAIPVVVYGNRNYDDALIELKDLMEACHYQTIAGAAFVGEHSFSRILGAGRPDKEDLKKADAFGAKVAAKIADSSYTTPVKVNGQEPYRPYYIPRMPDGSNRNIIKVFPKVNDKCVKCGLCVKVCPLGTIDPTDVSKYTGICIKCGACIKACPVEARYYDDEVYAYHKTNLEETFTRRAEPETFLG